MIIVAQNFFSFIRYLDVRIVSIKFVAYKFFGSVDPALFPSSGLEILEFVTWV